MGNHLSCIPLMRISRYKALGKPYLSLALMSAALGISMQAWAFCIFSACSLIPFGAYQAELFRLKKQSREKEW